MARRLFAGRRRGGSAVVRQIEQIPFQEAMRLLLEAGPGAAMRLPVVRRCIKFLAGRLAAMPITTTGRRPPWIDRPNAYCTPRDLAAMLVATMHLDGETFLLGVPTSTGAIGEVHVAPSQSMHGTMRPDRSGVDWQIFGKPWPGTVAHIRWLASNGDVHGIPALTALRDQSHIAREGEYGLRRSVDGTSVDVIVSGSGSNDTEAMEELVEEIEGEHSGSEGLGKVLLTAANVSIERINPSSWEKQLAMLSDRAQAQIAMLGFGLHPELVGIYLPNQSSLYRNVEDAAVRVWRDALRDIATARDTAYNELDPAAGIATDSSDEVRGTPRERAAQVRVMLEANKAAADANKDPLFTDEMILAAFGLPAA